MAITTIGNLMNEGAGKPKVVGVTIDSLLKTANKKGTDKKTSLLDHVVSTILKQDINEPILNFSQDIRDGSKIDIRDLRNDLNELERGIKNVNHVVEIEKKSIAQKITASDDLNVFFSESQKFLESANITFEKTRVIMKGAERSYQSLSTFFAEDLETFQVRKSLNSYLSHKLIHVKVTKKKHLRNPG